MPEKEERVSINGNSTDLKNLSIPAIGVISEKVVLKKVSLSYEFDENKKRTDTIECVRYGVVDPNSFDAFTIKVPRMKPVISPEELQMASKVIYIDIPVEQTVIRPYEIKYGKAKVTILAPSVSISKN